MADTIIPADRYQQQYFEVIRHLDEDNEPEAVRAAKRNLTDWSLPRYWQVKNCIIIVFAEEDWHEAEKYRLAAEDVYKEIDEFTPASDSKAREYLQDLRDDLDEVAQGQEEDKLEPGGAQEESTSKEEEKADEQDPLEILRATMVVRRQLARYPDEVTRINLGLDPDPLEHFQRPTLRRYTLMGHLDDLTAEEIETLMKDESEGDDTDEDNANENGSEENDSGQGDTSEAT